MEKQNRQGVEVSSEFAAENLMGPPFLDFTAAHLMASPVISHCDLLPQPPLVSRYSTSRCRHDVPPNTLVPRRADKTVHCLLSGAASLPLETTNINEVHSRTHPWNVKVRVACMNCRKRKVKCDGRSSCQGCKRHRVECSYTYGDSYSEPLKGKKRCTQRSIKTTEI